MLKCLDWGYVGDAQRASRREQSANICNWSMRHGFANCDRRPAFSWIQMRLRRDRLKLTTTLREALSV